MTRFHSLVGVLLVLALQSNLSNVVASEVDFIIRQATIIDGSGSPGIIGDIAIEKDRIVAIGEIGDLDAQRVIKGEGLIAAPGFIDLHSHSDRKITKPDTNANPNYLFQGVTSVVTGNCGSGPIDVGKYLAQASKIKTGTNVLHLIPHGTLRATIMKDGSRPATEHEIKQMKKLVENGMKDGAWGMSTGLIYVPGSFSTTEELIALAEVVGEHGGIYVSHMRNESTRLLEAVEELLEIGEKAELPVHISHFKASGPKSWGLALNAIELVKDARAKGQIVTADQYPYTASSTSLGAMVVPSQFRSREKLSRALKNPQTAREVKSLIQRSIASRGNGERLYVANFSKDRSLQGRNLAEIAKEQERPVLDLALDIQLNGGAQMINFGMSEEEVRMIMQQDFVATASDGSTRLLTDSDVPHPRSYGCFPRKIGHYSIRGGVLPVEAAIRSSSGLPADILGLQDRGYLKEGLAADIVLFDPKTFIDQATFEKPHRNATGVSYLFVNGQLAIDAGKRTRSLAGKSLRHTSK